MGGTGNGGVAGWLLLQLLRRPSHTINSKEHKKQGTTIFRFSSFFVSIFYS